jgi:phosphoribosylanthranilate isomerase
VNGSGPFIKVCGLTSQEDVSLCESLDIDLIGFIFHPKSPRCITPEAAGRIESSAAVRVGVFVDQGAEEIRRIMSCAGLDMAQLHGGQTEETCRAVGRERVIRVLWPLRYATKEKLEHALHGVADTCACLLLDAGTSGGGHGQPLEFTTLAGVAAPRPWILAGGLTPDNLGQAMLRCRPDGLDLNSGVEQRPGKKDALKLRAAVAAIRT